MFANLFGRSASVASPRNLVPRSTGSIRDQRGWTTYAEGWRGPYATQHGTWHGQIERAGGIFRPFIQQPPDCLTRHAKWHCFHQDRRPGWWRIHLQTQPADGSIDSVILYVERLLAESFRL